MIKPNGNPLIPYTKTVLPGGYTLLHKEVRTAPIAAIDIWIKAGAIDDPKPHYGLSHFFEHMFFKGTERHGVGVMDRIITSLGGYNNAATSLDYTHYFVVLPSPGWKEALDVLADSLHHPLFQIEEIERERSVIIEEIKRHEDNPWSKIYDEFTSTTFARCPYRRKVLGTEESLHTISRESFLNYHRERYHPGNITISLVGDLSLAEVRDELGRLLQSSNPSATGVVAADAEERWDVIGEPGETVLTRDVNQAYLLIGFPTPKITGTRDEYALELLATILGEGRSSRLYRRLNDELGIVSSISCNSWILAQAGLFLIEAVTEKARLDQVEKEIDNELKRVRESIQPDELAKAKSMSRADFAFSNEKVISIAHTYGYGHVTSSVEHAVHYQEKLEEITRDDIERTFDRLIASERRCRGLLVPKTG